MGVEQDYMMTLRDIEEGRSTDPLPMPADGYGGDTVNQKRLRTAVWFRQGIEADARNRALQYVKDEEAAGHCKIGNAPTEVCGTTHIQLHHGAASAILLQADMDGDDELFDKYLYWYRTEYAYSLACVVVLDSKEQVVTPGPRGYDKQGKPVLYNSLRTKVTLALRGGWAKKPKVGEGGYDVAILHLDHLFKCGRIKPKDITDGASYEDLTKRYGFNVQRLNGGGIYSWFDNLDANALEPVYGVGVSKNGKPLVCKTLEQALDVAEKVQRLGRLTA